MIQAMMQDWYREIVEDKYTLTFVIIIGGAGVFWGAKELYTRYAMHVGGKAQIVVAEAVEEYDKALYNYFEKEESKELALQQFDDVQIAFDTVLKQHSGSSLVPYALAIKADTFAYKGDFKSALSVLDSAISKMSVSAPGYYLLKTKYALMQLDAGQTEAALSSLKDLSFNSDNPTADTAAFFLGYYYWTIHDKEKARGAWKALEATDNKKVASGTSPWLQFAQEKLQNI